MKATSNLMTPERIAVFKDRTFTMTRITESFTPLP